MRGSQYPVHVRQAVRRQAVGRWLLGICLAVLPLVVGCRNPQTNSSDPFLPFMKTRVPPPGTTVPGTAAPLDPYYQGSPPAATTAPPVITTPATAPLMGPASTGGAGGDKYSPRGGWNVPQSSIDRSKVSDPRGGEVKAGAGTAIARRSLAQPQGEQSEVDTELTSAHATEPVDESTAATGHSVITSLTGEDADAALLAFADDPPHKTASRTSAEPVAAMALHPTDNTETTATALPSANSRLALATEAGGEQASTMRILTRSGDETADEPSVAQQPVVPSARLQLMADARESQMQSRGLAEESAGNGSVQRATFEAVEGASAVEFRQAADDGSRVVQAGWNENTSGAAAIGRSAAAQAPAGGDPYGHDGAYSRLSGKLEYSQSSRQWKLRYIPIDGATDAFGGSVVLGESSRMEAFQAGDFVTVEGAVVPTSGSVRGFSPRYELSRIDPVNQ